jgi:hypothetical protein
MAPFCYAGDPPHLIELTESAIAGYLAEVRQAWEQGIAEVFCLANYADFQLASHVDTLQLTLFFDVEPTPLGDVEYVWFSLPETSAELKQFGEILQLDQLVDLIASVCLGFGAYHGHIEDDQLLLLYRAVRAANQIRAAVPPELRQFVPEPLMPETVAGTLPQLMIPQEFDRRFVPDAIWWINFWDLIQVETVGQDRIATSNWARLIEQPGEALILVSTDEPTDVANAAHIGKLRKIVEHLNLRELQERYCYKKLNS